MDMLIGETNRYAASMKSSRPSFDIHINTEDLLAFLGLNIAMGMADLPSIRDYWSSEPLLHMPWYGSVMSRNKFCDILSAIHCANNEHPNEEDKLWKIRDLIDDLQGRCIRTYTPKMQLSIDEQMIGTRCRVSFLQYMPKKPAKFGIKVWTLCEAATGYVSNFQIYTGKSQDSQEHGLAHRVVMDLMQPFLDRGHCVYADNFFSSFPLCKTLLERGTYYTGTLRSDRKGVPNEIKPANLQLQQDDAVFLHNDDVCVTRWHDKRDVLALSTYHGSGREETEVTRSGKQRTKPTIIQEYNQYMGGVDRCDQQFVYYSVGRKCRKWWKKVFWRAFEICLQNALVIFREIVKKVTQKEFRVAICHAFVKPLLESRASARGALTPGRPASQNLARLQGKHFIYSKGEKQKKRCGVCSKLKSRSTGKALDTKTPYYCVKCNVHLCLGKCFEVYHTRVNLPSGFGDRENLL